MNTAKTAHDYAIACHAETNHTYDGKPYSYHLEQVVFNISNFDYLIPAEDKELVYAGGWTHDVQEDCRQTWNDVAKVCGANVAELSYALANEKGRTREQRANKKYYKGIRKTQYATLIKLCDRIANVTYSKNNGGKSSMFEKYKKENPKFEMQLLKSSRLWKRLARCFMSAEKYRTFLLNRHPYKDAFMHLRKLFD